MSVIIKDMDMPADCLGCRIILCDRESYLQSGRPKECPLNELVHCKDCRYYECGGLPCPLDVCESLGDDGFCSYGECRGGDDE